MSRRTAAGGLGALALVVLLAACAPPLVTMPAGPGPYRLGYAEGCDAGYAAAGSPLAFGADPAPPRTRADPYLAGWEGGFDACKRSYERIRRVATSLFGPPR